MNAIVFRVLHLGRGIREVHILDGVEELRDQSFCECRSLSSVTFSESSSLKLIGDSAFRMAKIETAAKRSS